MSRCEFLTWYGAGNLRPTVGVAQELVARGHEVGFAGYAGQRSRVDGLGFAFRLLPRADAAYTVAAAPPGRLASPRRSTTWARTPDRTTPARGAAIRAVPACPPALVAGTGVSAALTAGTPPLSPIMGDLVG